MRLGSLPADSDQDLRFVQDRLALFGKTTFLISSMFLVVGSVADLLRDMTRMSPVGRVSHAVGTLIALALWQALRRRHNFSPAALQVVDIVATLGIGLAFTAMGHYSAQPYGFYTGMLAVVHVSITRAMIVPSVPRRTLLLTGATFLGFVLSRATLPMPLALVQTGLRAREILEAILWATAGTAVSTVASKVIYDLHEKALEARQLGQYTLEEKIGEGGMGEIYRAHHAMLRRPTAVKLLSSGGSEEQLRRFEKEVQLTARLTHPNTISIYDYGRTPDGVFYYAMELLKGMSLEQLVERGGPQPAARVIHLLRQVCGALNEAHGLGLIHRDIKPANIYLCRQGDMPDVVKVLDFGLVREIRAGANLTRSNVNAIVGTPLYMAPESILSPDKIDARADVYGLGCVAYYLLTGTAPFGGQSVVEVCGHHLHTPPTPPSERHAVPADLERLVLACLAKDPKHRPQSARALRDELELCRDATGWSETNAELWWAELPCDGSEQRDAPASSGERPRRTICLVDLVRRLGNDATRS
ncbi:MAG TPA: serine/threonine-protein kinase [Polyangiaceae bacterium]|nr:serine/threonine-protein kinase [Polyangiaceae bacterium]